MKASRVAILLSLSLLAAGRAGAEPSFLPNDEEAVWTLEDQRHVYVVHDGQRAGGGHLTLFVTDLQERTQAISQRGIEPTTDETYGNGVRKVEYHDPDGEPIFCANTEVGDLRVSLFRRTRFGRWREATVLHAPRTAHFEVARRERDPAIGKLHTRL